MMQVFPVTLSVKAQAAANGAATLQENTSSALSQAISSADMITATVRSFTTDRYLEESRMPTAHAPRHGRKFPMLTVNMNRRYSPRPMQEPQNRGICSSTEA
ncbi:MAG: hypothetical protein J6Y01_04875 [Spirochaetales bacterium]|nr:hypothetical protein [Spirochaetales bacterium]